MLGHLRTCDMDIASSTHYRLHDFWPGCPVLPATDREHHETSIDCLQHCLCERSRICAPGPPTVMWEDQHICVQLWMVIDQIVKSDPIYIACDQEAWSFSRPDTNDGGHGIRV